MRCAGRRLLGRRGLGCRMPLHLRKRAISRKVAKWHEFVQGNPHSTLVKTACGLKCLPELQRMVSGAMQLAIARRKIGDSPESTVALNMEEWHFCSGFTFRTSVTDHYRSQILLYKPFQKTKSQLSTWALVVHCRSGCEGWPWHLASLKVGNAENQHIIFNELESG